MTDLHNMTKAALNAFLAPPLSPSQLKKTTHADLIAMFDAMPPADALDADLLDACTGTLPLPTPNPDHADHAAFVSIRKSASTPPAAPTTLQKPAKAAQAAEAAAPKAMSTKAAQVAPTATRKPGRDCILFIPADSQKEPKAGSKRAAIIDLLRAPTGTTVEDIAAATGWSRAVAGSALYVDVKGSGWGVERKDGRLHLLPQGAK